MKHIKKLFFGGSINANNPHSSVRIVLVYVIIAFMLSLTIWIGWTHGTLHRKKEQQRFAFHVDAILRDITQQLYSFGSILQGGAGVFIASEHVSREEWQDYLASRHIPVHYPGSRGIGVSWIVHAHELDHHIQKLRNQGFNDYSVWPAAEREVFSPVVFMEFFDASSQQMLGYDMFSDQVYKTAMEKARDSRKVTLSAKVELIHTELQTPGFLLFAPLIGTGIPLDTSDESRAIIRGYIFSMFVVDDFMREILKDSEPRVNFKLYDGSGASPATLMYTSHVSSGVPAERSRPMFTAQKVLDIYNHQWTLVFEPTALFEAEVDKYTTIIIVSAGILCTLLFFVILKLSETTTERALTLANTITLELHEREERYQQLTNNLPLGVSLIGPDMEVLAANTTLRKWYPEYDHTIQQKCYEVYHIPPRSEPCMGCPVVLTFRTGQPQVVERQTITSNGPRTLLIRTAPLFGPDGKVIKVHETEEDITEHKAAETAIAKAKADWEKTFDAVPDAIAILDIDHKIIRANHALASRLGISAGQVVGKLCYKTLHGTDVPPPFCPHQQLLADGNEHVVEMDIERLGGHFSVSASPLRDDEGRLTGSVHVARDITDRKVAEAERINRIAAEDANRQKTVFLSTMSHEIRTPMNVILGFAQILHRDSSLSPRQIEQINSIMRSGTHLLNLINDILDLSRIEAGRIALQSVDFDLGSFLDELTQMFRSRTNAKNIQLMIDRDENTPAYVHGDEDKLRQVLINLIGNAVKFTELGGIAVRVRSTVVATQAEKDEKNLRLEFEVEDSGPGISESDQVRIFESFEQAEAGIKTGGTGLGLTISRKLVQMMGGTLTVESVEGRGSCFRFDVLLEPAQAIPAAKKREMPRVVGLEPGTGPWRILLVDDIADNRLLLRELLWPLGFEIREAENGKDAIRIFLEWSPHAVLMDMRMPVMDGYEATRLIKATEAGRTTPVIAVTASAFKDSMEQILATGVSAYLRKPFQPEELYEILQQNLELQYIYADDPHSTQLSTTPPSLTAESLATLPQELVLAMQAAVAEGDINQLLELISQVKSLDTAIAQGLETLAMRYDYKTLHELFDKGEHHE
jgi:PAS domain S-box-containing protein